MGWKNPVIQKHQRNFFASFNNKCQQSILKLLNRREFSHSFFSQQIFSFSHDFESYTARRTIPTMAVEGAKTALLGACIKQAGVIRHTIEMESNKNQDEIIRYENREH